VTDRIESLTFFAGRGVCDQLSWVIRVCKWRYTSLTFVHTSCVVRLEKKIDSFASLEITMEIG
jgi:hypothetical protein